MSKKLLVLSVLKKLYPYNISGPNGPMPRGGRPGGPGPGPMGPGPMGPGGPQMGPGGPRYPMNRPPMMGPRGMMLVRHFFFQFLHTIAIIS